MNTTLKTLLLALSLTFAACDAEPTATAEQPDTGGATFWCPAWTAAKTCPAACVSCVKQYSCSSLSISVGNTGECIDACATCQ
jgi:hypothetical protein